MKKEKSVVSVVSNHIFMTSVIFPFFGLFIGYFVLKFFNQSLNENGVLIVLIRDFINILFFFVGVKYSLSYINKKINVKNPINSSKYSIILFGILVFCLYLFIIINTLNVISIIYNTIYFGIIFFIFYFFTKKFFNNLEEE